MNSRTRTLSIVALLAAASVTGLTAGSAKAGPWIGGAGPTPPGGANDIDVYFDYFMSGGAGGAVVESGSTIPGHEAEQADITTESRGKGKAHFVGPMAAGTSRLLLIHPCNRNRVAIHGAGILPPLATLAQITPRTVNSYVDGRLVAAPTASATDSFSITPSSERTGGRSTFWSRSGTARADRHFGTLLQSPEPTEAYATPPKTNKRSKDQQKEKQLRDCDHTRC
ncbi:MAG TPA: hypothetical protein VMV94_13745 [Phycisphaerae bacterium]|nr:hypothetical protein [Phycisphaerae bacterium]